MRKVFLAFVTGAMLSGAAIADDVKIGIILGFTGPIESLTPAMAAGAELAIAEVNASGSFMGERGLPASVQIQPVLTRQPLQPPPNA